MIRRTADNLTAVGPERQRIVQALMSAAGQIPKRQQTASTIQKMVTALLTGQSGRAGYEAQNAFDGPAGR